MPKFSKKSLEKLKTCHPMLQEICNEAIKFVDFSVLVGHRNKEKQNEAVNKNRSTLRYPNSRHNSVPSMAVDLAPYPVNWYDKKRFCYLAGLMVRIGYEKGVALRWGGDWDMDGELNDQIFNDLPHFEISEIKEDNNV